MVIHVILVKNVELAYLNYFICYIMHMHFTAEKQLARLWMGKIAFIKYLFKIR